MLVITNLFHVDGLSCFMGALIIFVSACVASFSARYLKGDAALKRFYTTLSLLVVSVLMLVTADYIGLFLTAWAASNILLVRLMIHKSSWVAARESGSLAFKNFCIGFVALALAFALLYAETGETSIQLLVARHYPAQFLAIVLSLIFVAAMTQSALWPFHRWLTSSLNAPTPVSAIMHAGLVNGGGFLLARFSLLYFELPQFLSLIFVAGLMTAFLGTLWKLMQNDVKRMLACSTMGQMGFLIAQCGLGLFPAALSHLVWHGLFKAYLFLASGAAAKEKRLDLGYPPPMSVFVLSLICGIVGAYVFTVSAQINLMAGDTTLFLAGMSFITGAQLAMPVLRPAPRKRFPLALIVTSAAGGLYGLSVYGFEMMLAPLDLMQPQLLTAVYVTGFFALAGAWLAMLFGRNAQNIQSMPQWMLRWYVWMLNASQPHPKTITTHRNDYQYQ